MSAFPEIINGSKTWQNLMKEHADLEPIVMKYKEYRDVLDSIKRIKRNITRRIR